MRFTVVICTLNRAASLERALQSLTHQSLGPEQYEVLVVDNGSVDGTGAVVRRISERHANLRYIREPERGLSRARNRGLAEAGGEWVAFLDDDAEADSGWLAAIQAAGTAEKIGAVGGKVTLHWPRGRPAWLPQSLEGYFSGLDRGNESQILTARPYPFGTNMAVRRDLALSVGGFAPQLGRQGAGLGSHEETEFFDRLVRGGHRICYEPRAVVTHHVPPERVSRAWLLRRVLAEGRSRVTLLHLLRDAHRPQRVPAAWAVYRTALAEGLRRRWRPPGPPETPWLHLAAAAAYTWGCTVGSAAALLRPPADSEQGDGRMRARG